MEQNLVFLKLGGSLITDKAVPRMVLPEVINRLAMEIKEAKEIDPKLNIVLGHGSGSFGHVPARKYHTINGVSTALEWRGFVEVWKEAAALNHLVMGELEQTGLPAIAFPASASLITRNRQVYKWNIRPIELALQAGLMPVIYGDVIFDHQIGGTIFSTEDLFAFLAPRLKPQRILLAGIEEGVWADFPSREHLLREVTLQTFDQIKAGLGGSAGTDVTGGMAGKVNKMLQLLNTLPGLEIRIFSGIQPGRVKMALLGESIGSLICN